MSERKFTPPTEFPAKYANGNVVLAVKPNGALIGHDVNMATHTWRSDGACVNNYVNPLIDAPKRVTIEMHMHAVRWYEMLGHAGLHGEVGFVVTCDENGDNPTIEKVE